VRATAPLLTVAATGPGRVNLGQARTFHLFHRLTDRSAVRQIHFDAFRTERLDSPSAHAPTNDTVDRVPDELIHRVARPVVMVGIAIINHPRFTGFGVAQGEVGSRPEMTEDLSLGTFVAGRGDANQHDQPL
jgi:hypothetical protein